MRTRHKILTAILLLVAVTFAVSAIVIRSRSFQVGYHKWQMDRAYDAHYTEPDVYQDGLVGFTLDDDYERFEYHRGELIKLEAVLELHYTFQHIQKPTDEGNHFSKFIMTPQRPGCIEFSSPYPNNPEPMQLTVWCYPSDKAGWDQLIQSRDVPDYRARFMQ